MFEIRRRTSHASAAAALLELIYHGTVRSVRRTHANAVAAILLNILQTVILVASFVILFRVLGLRGSAIRGDYLLFVMSGVFLYMVHTRTVQALYASEGFASPAMKHRPMTPAVAIASAALGALYIQILSMVSVLYVYHAGWGPIEIETWQGGFAMVILSWLWGIAVGLVLLAIKPWFPTLGANLLTVYNRVGMIVSGKMFVANALPAYMLGWFDWNPLFHIIDQARGYVFLNYVPYNSTVSYPVGVTLTVLMLGLIAQSHTRRHASLSWAARR